MPAGAIDFSSNDYLGMASHAGTVARLRAATQVGSGGSRLLSGAHPEHVALEADLAAWTGREAALLFSSGYLAALGAIVALAPFVDYIASDERNHACAIDAVRLTKLPRTIHAHDAPLAPDPRVPTMFVTESLFGMTGTRIDVAARVAMLAPDDVLVVDEAHALGVVGPAGAGACAPYADPRIVVIGTLSKALGGLGGFVAGPRDAIAYLATAARTFVFDTAMPPGCARQRSARRSPSWPGPRATAGVRTWATSRHCCDARCTRSAWAYRSGPAGRSCRSCWATPPRRYASGAISKRAGSTPRQSARRRYRRARRNCA
ncbi:MAG: hypothetical protein NVSMB59_12550 [Vulcanimicrobiaceae bacterium]